MVDCILESVMALAVGDSGDGHQHFAQLLGERFIHATVQIVRDFNCHDVRDTPNLQLIEQRRDAW